MSKFNSYTHRLEIVFEDGDERAVIAFEIIRSLDETAGFVQINTGAENPRFTMTAQDWKALEDFLHRNL